MTIAYWCVLLAALLPIVWAACAKIGGEGFDNARPRAYLHSLSGWRLRAHWAQENSYEAFPPFAAGVVIAHLVNGPSAMINVLAMLFLAARILHGIFYIADQSTLRSLVWLAGFGSVIALFVTAGL
jgi:uncharacterized MAPEG superfamily protein